MCLQRVTGSFIYTCKKCIISLEEERLMALLSTSFLFRIDLFSFLPFYEEEGTCWGEKGLSLDT